MRLSWRYEAVTPTPVSEAAARLRELGNQLATPDAAFDWQGVTEAVVAADIRTILETLDNCTEWAEQMVRVSHTAAPSAPAAIPSDLMKQIGRRAEAESRARFGHPPIAKTPWEGTAPASPEPSVTPITDGLTRDECGVVEIVLRRFRHQANREPTRWLPSFLTAADSAQKKLAERAKDWSVLEDFASRKEPK